MPLDHHEKCGERGQFALDDPSCLTYKLLPCKTFIHVDYNLLFTSSRDLKSTSTFLLY